MGGRCDLDVEEVLNSATALEYFKEFMRLDPSRKEEAVDLYFALKGFKNYLRSRDAALIAQTIHRKYISLKSGTCDFLPTEVRQEMSYRIHALKPNVAISLTLFDPVWQPLINTLKAWHARFVYSEPYSRLKENKSQDSREDYEMMPAAPPETMRRLRKPRYSCEPSTSRPFKEEARAVFDDKRHDIPYRHDIPEERNRFAMELSAELQKIVDQIAQQEGELYPRDLPKPSVFEFSTKEKNHEKTLSDEELEKYAEKLDRRRSDSESPPGATFVPNPLPFVSSVPGYDFNVAIPSRLTYNNKKTRTPAFHEGYTSGFCSSESAYFSDRSYRSNRLTETSFSQTPLSNTLQRLPRRTQQNAFATLPRHSSQPLINCRLWRIGEEAPYSADLVGANVTLYQFRRTFGIRRDENLRLFFKSPCEDGSALFQWSLISEDSSILPFFNGKIEGEARHYEDSD